MGQAAKIIVLEEVKEKLETYRLLRKSQKEAIPEQLRGEIIDYVLQECNKGNPFTKTLALIGLSHHVYYDWRNKGLAPSPWITDLQNEEKRLKEKSKVVNITKYDPKKEPEVNHNYNKNIKITIEHPLFGNLVLTGTKAKRFWRYIAGL